MKASRVLRVIAVTAASALALSGLAGVAVAPANAATKSTLVIQIPNPVTSLNSSTSDGNTTYNSYVGYLTNSGFTYYDSDPKLVRNTAFGTMAVVVNKPKDYQIKYTVKPGRVWSDGTPIDGTDLLLSHILLDDKYSKSAGLGDPSAASPAFDSVGYGGTYGENVVGLPTLSADKMSVTVKFSKPLADWELLAPGVSPVHALELMVDGKKKLGTAAENKAAKAKFLADFTKKNTTRLKKMGEIWTQSYNLGNIDSTTNPLLLVSNGGYIVKSAVKDQSITLVTNPKYNSGPAISKTNPVKTIVLKTITNDTAAVTALRNGDVDVYFNTNPTATGMALLEQVPNVNITSKSAASYSHFGLRVGAANGGTDPYTGPFFGNSAKAKDLRHAFLLALPREQMSAKGVQPANFGVMDTQFAFKGSSEYTALTKANGNAEYSVGTQAERTAKALALVQKHYPTASGEKAVVPVKLLFANASSLRVTLGKLIQAEAKKAGFDVDATGLVAWSDNLENVAYDATMYGFALTALSQSNSTAVYKSDGGSNVWGWSNSTIDKLATELEGGPLTAKEVTAKRLAIDKIVHDNYWGLPLYQGVTVTAAVKSLKNLKAAPLSPNFFWNFWEWRF